MKEKSELLEQLLDDFTRSDLPSMQETREYLEALLNVFVHDFAKNDLLFMEETMYAQVTGGLMPTVDSFKSVFIHNLAKSNLLLLMQETREHLVSVLILNFTSILPDQNVCGSTIILYLHTHHYICSGYWWARTES